MIRELEEQIRSFECQEVNRDLEESKVEESKDYDAHLVASECMELETNFEQAILAREEETNILKNDNDILTAKVARLED